MARSRFVQVDTRIEGIDDFVRELRGSPERLDKELRKEFRTIAAEVRDQARGAASARRPASSGIVRRTQPQHWQDLVMSIRSGADSDSPYVSVGSGVPWALGHEFGSLQGPGRRQFPPWRGNKGGAGYFLWPTIRAARASIQAKALAAIDRAMHPAFPE
jgi:hypothetical protein